MLKFKAIVGAACVSCMLVLAACGQKGPLVLPKEPAAQNRATLPQVLNSSSSASAPISNPAAPASAPKR